MVVFLGAVIDKQGTLFLTPLICVCVRTCVRVCVRACVRACVRVLIQWRTLGEIPFGIEALCRHPCVHHGKLFAALWKRHGSKYTANIYAADLEKLSEWVPLRSKWTLPERSQPSSCLVELISHGDDLYRITSSEAHQPCSIVVMKQHLRAGDSAMTDVWTDVTTLPTSRANFGVGLVAGMLVIVGGTTGVNWQASEADLSVVSLDLASGGTAQWCHEWPRLPEKCCWPQIVVCGDFLHLFNGVYVDGKATQRVLSLNLSRPKAERRWRQSLPHAQIRPTCGVVTNSDRSCILVAGGFEKRFFYPVTCPKSVHLYLAKEDRWFDLPSMEFEHAGCSLVCTGNKIICFGGHGQLSNEYHSQGRLVRNVEVLTW